MTLSRLECPLCCKSFCLVCRTSPWHTGVRCETWQAGPEPEPEPESEPEPGPGPEPEPGPEPGPEAEAEAEP